ncbi:MAG: PQQ-dependent dehydrogenase, methanol/ethanol family [Pseudomonadota bacterium]|jgi:alcohol dehydrogenase (cytochrome c)|nr:PQQ-dependent dehydrogenase, methanol/ethanol family [Rubrivivax sp.]MCA3253896.1 PQQ-dependent dehydrogenase, methanol/ethanol family [Rubrivivax sp.]MCZ8033072.1 PQQ-dependent dehydrogenase, methanol/ethanol family [Rubrivivax sp.]
MSHSRLPRRLVATLLALAAAPLAAQSLADLRNDAATPGNVTTYGMGWAQHRHAGGKQITPANARRLVPVWNLSLDNSANASTQPLVIDGVMYLTTHSHTVAVNALTGRQLWKTPIELPADINGFLCCGIHSRGAAALDGVLYRTTLDAQVVALSMKDGKQIWKSKAADYKQGYSMTHAPLIAGNTLITGISGGEYGARGFLKGWDLKTGQEKWHRWTTAGPGDPGGDTWKPGMAENGGAPTWLTGSYDPELDLVYWGTGNGSPWNPASRGGDSKHIGSVLAIRPNTGEIVWTYQFSPGDPYDYDGTNELVLAEMAVGGKPTKVVMQANRNGFFYVLDRTNGKLLRADQFAKKVNWATGIDLASGRPIDTPMTAMLRKTEEQTDFIEVWPSAFGGKNWAPMSYDPGRRLAFFNTINLGMKVKYVKQSRPGGPNWWLGLELGGFPAPEDGLRGSLVAWDPASGKKVWEVPSKAPNWSGVLSTAGGVVFVGTQTGQFKAYDAKNGKELWSFQTGSGISGLPIAWEHQGRQYITVTSGAATVYAALAGDPELGNMPAGSSLWTFALMP